MIRIFLEADAVTCKAPFDCIAGFLLYCPSRRKNKRTQLELQPVLVIVMIGEAMNLEGEGQSGTIEVGKRRRESRGRRLVEMGNS